MQEMLACATNLHSATLHELLQLQQVRAPDGSGANDLGMWTNPGRPVLDVRWCRRFWIKRPIPKRATRKVRAREFPSGLYRTLCEPWSKLLIFRGLCRDYIGFLTTGLLGLKTGVLTMAHMGVVGLHVGSKELF